MVEIIIKNRDILGGTPVFRGTRVPIQTLFDLCLPKMSSGANAVEISDIQEDETEASLVRRSEQCYIALKNRWMEFLRITGTLQEGLP
jgi:hypothetical protein